MKWELLGVCMALPAGLVSFKAFITIALQNKFIYCGYFPLGSRKYVNRPEFAIQHKIKARDGTELEVWSMPHSDTKRSSLPTLLYFQGNAGNLGHRHRHLNKLISSIPINIIAVHYRGYGGSKGSGSECGLQMDADAILKFCIEQDWVRSDRLVAYGQSLGGAVAIDLVYRNPGRFKGLIVENTFTSIKDMIPAIYPKWSIYRKLTPFLWNHWPSLERIRSVDVPVLILSGKADEIVPFEHSDLLLDNCPNGILKRFEYGMHDDTWRQSGYIDTIRQFISRS
jgi:abhydrolase domain-containing protein 13